VPTPVTIAGKAVRGQIIAKDGQVIENVHVKTSSGSCIVVKGVRNVTIRDSEIGPCGAPGGRGGPRNLNTAMSGNSAL
jgi:hypothetical protein